MKKVTFIKSFNFSLNERETLNFPDGWSGIVDDDVAEAAADDGAIEGSEPVADEAEAAADDGKSKKGKPAAVAGATSEDAPA